MRWRDDVLRFWFDELQPADWFITSAAVDALVHARFGGLREALKANPPPIESLGAAGHLATVIVFDQFSRNLFRGLAEAFATDDLALTYASDALSRELDTAMNLEHRHFLYMPFMHAENIKSQDRSVELFTRLGAPDLLGYAEEHRRIVARFGRFPARNAALGRDSTPAERDYLASLERKDSCEARH
jgi:uncharacterized protein (DUF924 family)